MPPVMHVAFSSNQVMSESSGSAASFVSCKGQLSCVFILKLIWMMVPVSLSAVSTTAALV